MTRRTRYFMFGSAAVLLAGSITGLVAYYGGFPSAALARTGPEELRYVPAEATVLAYANVRDVMMSDLRQRLRSVEPSGRERQEFEERTGINLEQDIDHVVGCMVPDGREAGGLVLLRGRFDQMRLESLAREHGAMVEEYRGKRLFVPSRAADRGDDAPTVGFLEPGLVAFGDAGSVRRAVDLQAGGSNVTGNDTIMRLVGEIQNDANAWAVGRLDDLATRSRLPDDVARQLPAVQWFAASGRVNGGVSGTLRAEARDEEAAENLRDVARGFLALAKLQTSNRPELQRLLQSLELSGVGTTVALSFSIPAEVVDLLAPRAQRDRP